MRCRLKMQMVSEQDAEDDKLQWKVEAEVQAATKAAAAAREAAEAREKALQARLEAFEKQTAGLESNLTAWESAVAERDTEIRNLQARVLDDQIFCLHNVNSPTSMLSAGLTLLISLLKGSLLLFAFHLSSPLSSQPTFYCQRYLSRNKLLAGHSLLDQNTPPIHL